MLRYTIRRILQFIPVWFGVATLVFLMIHIIPGDPVIAIVGGRPLPAETIESLRHELGLDRPIHVQYIDFLSRVLRGDFGRSIVSGLPVIHEISWRLPYTVQLAVVGLGLAIPFGVFLGVMAAIHRETIWDTVVLVGSLVFISVPGFWFGLLLIYLFGVWLKWLPIGGTEGIKTLIMPSVVMAISAAPALARLTRTSMIEVLRSDYVRTARAYGFTEAVVIVKHALRNALNPVVTVTGLSFASMLGGAFIIEQVFSRPGLGRLAVQSIYSRDIPMIQGIVLYSATLFLVCNLLVDLSYTLLDPRVRQR